MSLENALTSYLDDMRERHLSERTIESARARIGSFTARHPGREISTVTPIDIDLHFIKLREKGLADGTLAGHKKCHRTFWSWCLRNHLILVDPAAILNSHRHRYSFRPVHSRAAPVSDFSKVVMALEPFAAHRGYNPRDVRDAALVSITIDSSARRGELYNLRRVDIEKSLLRGEKMRAGTVYHVSSQGKTGAANIRYFAETASLLSRWLAHLQEMQPESLWLWVNLRSGRRLRVDILKLAFERICAFAGVPAFRFHAVRKRNVTDIIQLTGDQKAGQLYAGHTDERTTQRYYNDLQEARVDESAAFLAAQRRSPEQEDLANDFFQRLK